MKSSKIYAMGTITSAASILVSILVNIALVPILLSNLGKEQYGVWITLSSIFSAMNIADLGIGQSVSKLISGHSDNSNDKNYIGKIVSTAFFTSLFISIAVLIINILVSFFIGGILNLQIYNIQGLYIILCVNFLVNFVFSIFNNVLIGYKKIYISNILIIARSIFMLISNYLFFKFSSSVENLGFVYLAISIIVFIMTIMFITRSSNGSIISLKLYDKSLLKIILKPGLYFFLIQVSGIIVYNTDNIVLSNFVGVAVVSLYFSAYKIIDIFMKIIFVISDNMFPFISGLHGKKQIQRIKKLNLTTSKLSLMIGMFLAIMYYFYSFEIIKIWVGADNFIGYNVIILLCFVLIINASSHNAGVYINALYKHKNTAYMSILEGILNLIFSIILVKKIGVVGVALGTVMSAVLTSAWYTPYYCCKVLKITFNKYFSEVLLRNIIVASLFIGILYLQKKSFYVSNFMELLVYAIIDFIIFALLAYGLALNKSEKSKIKEVLYKFIKTRSGAKVVD